MYDTTVRGGFRVEPALNSTEVAYLRAFARSRRVQRAKGPCAVHDLQSGYTLGVASRLAADVIDNNQPAEGQPGLWCPWEVSEDGRLLQWSEFPARAALLLDWLQYLIDHFFRGSALNHADVRRAHEEQRFEAFSFDHQLLGVAQTQGEDPGDCWMLSVAGMEAVAHKGVLAFDPPRR